MIEERLSAVCKHILLAYMVIPGTFYLPKFKHLENEIPFLQYANVGCSTVEKSLPSQFIKESPQNSGTKSN